MSSAGDGVYGVYNGTSHISAEMLAGVVGDTDEDAAGVLGLSSGGDGVYGVASGKSGVSTSLRAGVVGDNDSLGPGVIGLSNACGVYGILTAHSSLTAISAGVTGDSSTGIGVLGMSGGADGVHGLTSKAGASAVAGIDQATGDTSHGVYGSSDNGIGGYFQGGRAPIFSSRPVHPARPPLVSTPKARSTWTRVGPSSSAGQAVEVTSAPGSS
jgi:hypothetical protein